MKRPVMRDLYAVAVAFLGPHCVNGGADIWLRASLVWKATAVAPSVHHQRKRHLRSRSDSGVTFSAKSGARRIQSELKRLHSISLAIATIHKVLCQNQVKPVVKFRRKADFIRYERPVPGDRVQMDTCKIGPGLYQYTSIDDCTRYRVLRLYSSHGGKHTGFY